MTKTDREFPTHLADAYAPPPLSPAARARLARRVREGEPSRARPLARASGRLAAVSFATAACAALALALVFAADPAGEAARPGDVRAWPDPFDSSWEDDVLYAPEWIDQRADWLDAEIVPMAYDGAAFALDS